MANVLEPWESLADALLQREALLCRIGRGVPPREFAGLYVGDHRQNAVEPGFLSGH